MSRDMVILVEICNFGLKGVEVMSMKYKRDYTNLSPKVLLEVKARSKVRC